MRRYELIEALAAKQSTTAKGVANGYAGLDAGGLVPVAQLPAGSPSAWGTITGTLSAQTDLQAALDAKQPLDTDLTAIGALVSAADRLPYATGAGTWALATFTVAGRALVDDADAATQRTTLGLGSVDNTSDAAKPVSTAQQTALDLKANLASPTFTGTVAGITAAMVGAPSGSGTVSGTNTGDQTITLTGNVTGSGTGSFAATIANGAVTLAKMADMATASLIYRKTAGAGAPEVNTLATLKTDLALVKGDVGLGNVDNTSDPAKPVSTATQTALDAKQATLVSATNIKTINGSSVLGSGDLVVTGSQPDIPLTKIAPATSQTITAGHSAYVCGPYEIAAATILEIGAGACMEIG